MLILKTERTKITEMSTKDAPFILKLVNSEGWLKFIGDRNIHSITDAENYISNTYIGTRNQYGFTYYLVSSLDNSPIGICGFLQKVYLKNPDFGFAFMTDFHNQGFGYESGKAILEYGITEFDIQNVDAITLPDNIPSKKLLRKLGFVESGIISMPESNEKLNLFCFNS